VTDLAALGRKK